MECRYDWHQTATHSVVAIYGKKYDPSLSYVELSPVRMKCHLVFPEQGGSFNMDIELRGVSYKFFQSTRAAKILQPLGCKIFVIPRP